MIIKYISVTLILFVMACQYEKAKTHYVVLGKNKPDVMVVINYGDSLVVRTHYDNYFRQKYDNQCELFLAVLKDSTFIPSEEEGCLGCSNNWEYKFCFKGTGTDTIRFECNEYRGINGYLNHIDTWSKKLIVKIEK